jgi:hypothetical protein
MTFSEPNNPLGLDLLTGGFDEFLFSSIGAEPNGSELSMLSAFARRDRDPWREAARLGGLPAGRAVETIASFIEEFDELDLTSGERRALAERLARLLPKARVAVGRKTTRRSRLRRLVRSPGAAYLAVLILVFVLLGTSLLHHH